MVKYFVKFYPNLTGWWVFGFEDNVPAFAKCLDELSEL